MSLDSSINPLSDANVYDDLSSSDTAPEFYVGAFARRLSDAQITNLVRDLALDHPDEAAAVIDYIRLLRSGSLDARLGAENTEVLSWRMYDSEAESPDCSPEVALAAMILLLWQHRNPAHARVSRLAAIVTLVNYACRTASLREQMLFEAFFAKISAPLEDAMRGEQERLPYAGLACLHLLAAGKCIEQYLAATTYECIEATHLSDGCTEGPAIRPSLDELRQRLAMTFDRIRDYILLVK